MESSTEPKEADMTTLTWTPQDTVPSVVPGPWDVWSEHRYLGLTNDPDVAAAYQEQGYLVVEA